MGKYFTIGFLLLIWGGVLRAEVSVELTVDQVSLAVEDEVQLTVTVRGARNAGDPHIKGLDAFEVESRGTSSRINIINGSTTMETGYQYSLIPLRPGNFKIGPAEVTYQGKTYTSRTIQLNVGKRAAAKPEEENVRIEATVRPRSPYVNQQVIYEFKLYSRNVIYSPQLNLPDFAGFWKERLGDQRESREIINGIPWNVTTLQYALFPLSSGEIQIPRTQLRAQVPVQRRRGRHDPFFDDFFFNRQGASRAIRLTSESIQMQVKSLPNAPKGFQGLVGKFKLAAEVSDSNVKVGDSITITATVEGDGNLGTFKYSFPPSDLYKVYEDEADSSSRISNGRLITRKVFKWALVPLKEGGLGLSELSLDTFDPDLGEFQTLKAPLGTLQVKPGSGENLGLVPGAAKTRREDIKSLGNDLMSLKRSPSEFRGVPLSETGERVGFGLIFLFPTLWGLLFGLRRKFEWNKGNAHLIRKAGAYRQFKKSLPDSATLEKLSLLLREYLSDRFGVDGGALTSADVDRRLGNLRPEQRELLKTYLQKCETALYGGGSLWEGAKTQLSELVDALEKEGK